jgi:hypothetical protein
MLVPTHPADFKIGPGVSMLARAGFRKDLIILLLITFFSATANINVLVFAGSDVAERRYILNAH